MKQRLQVRPETIATLDELESVEWFRNVGRARPRHALAVRTWDEALPYLDKLESENVRLEAANGISEALFNASREAFNEWNDRVDLLKPLTEALVREKAAPFIQRQRWPRGALDTVRWDILHLAMEVEYGEWVKPPFYVQLAYWYREGHFPLGWEGEVFNGKLVVY